MVGRLDSIEFPQVWTRFEKTLADGTVKRFKIQDVTEDMYDDVIEFMDENFLKDEPFTLASGVLSDPVSREKMHTFWKKYVLSMKLSLICLEDNDDCRVFMKPPIVGFNFLIHSVKGHKRPEEFAEPPSLLRILEEVDSKFDLYKKFNIKEYLTAAGLAVNREYRGMNIGAELLKARTPLCKAMGIKVTETIFSAKGSQVLAAKAGFETLMEFQYDDLAKKLAIQFPDMATKTIKVMTKVID